MLAYLWGPAAAVEPASAPAVDEVPQARADSGDGLDGSAEEVAAKQQAMAEQLKERLASSEGAEAAQQLIQGGAP